MSIYRFMSVNLLILLLVIAGPMACNRESAPEQPQNDASKKDETSLQAGASMSRNAVSPSRDSQPPVKGGVAQKNSRSHAGEQVTTRNPSRVFLKDPLRLQRVEISTEALSVWRRFREVKPVLLLLSNEPMLAIPPEGLRQEAMEWIASASQEEISRRTLPDAPDMLLAPGMTIDAALRSGWISQLDWIVPNPDSGTTISAEVLGRQLRAFGMASDDEVAGFRNKSNSVAGTLRGIPFGAMGLDAFTSRSNPVILHIDQSFFQSMYKNEIATPLLKTIADVLNALREHQIQVLAVTFSQGNLDERISLDVRFTGDMIASLVEDPKLLDMPVSKIWLRQGDALYLANFMKKEKIRELLAIQEMELPNSAWVKFSLYRAAAEQNEGSRALEYLEQAVSLDRVYALEYLSLSELAFSRGRPDEALRMLNLARNAFPESPSISLKTAQHLIEMGDHKSALPIVLQLQKLPWSAVYYSKMPEYLQALLGSLEAPHPMPMVHAGPARPDDHGEL